MKYKFKLNKIQLVVFIILFNLSAVVVFAADDSDNICTPDGSSCAGPVIFQSPANAYLSYPLVIREITNKTEQPYPGGGSVTDFHVIEINGTFCYALSNGKKRYEEFYLSCARISGMTLAVVTKSLTVQTVDGDGNRHTFRRGAPLNTALVWLYKRLISKQKISREPLKKGNQLGSPLRN